MISFCAVASVWKIAYSGLLVAVLLRVSAWLAQQGQRGRGVSCRFDKRFGVSGFSSHPNKVVMSLSVLAEQSVITRFELRFRKSISN